MTKACLRSACALIGLMGSMPAALAQSTEGPPPTPQSTRTQPPTVENGNGKSASTGNGEVGEIIVTAQKRSENLQNVPIAVSVATAETLQSSGVAGIQSLKVAIPSVGLNTNVGWVLPTIRGVASKATGALLESPNAIYVDGVYYASTTSTLLSFSNIEQISVLKGPQGTLFGRNATGGVIQVTTRDPSEEFGGTASLGYGNYETLTNSLYLTGGIAPGVAVDFSFQGKSMGNGYGINFFNGSDVGRVKQDYGLRSKLRARLGSGTVIRLAGDYSKHVGSDSVQRYGQNVPFPAGLGPSYGGTPWDTDVNVQPLLKTRNGGVSLTIDQEIGSLGLTSISAYREGYFQSIFDTDYSAVNAGSFNLVQKDVQYSQEVQLQSGSGGAFTWTIGGFYFNARSSYDPAIVSLAPPGPAQIAFRTKSTADSIAAFGQATYKITDKWSFTAGGRYTTEERTLDVNQQVIFPAGGPVLPPTLVAKRQRFGKFTWRLSTDYQLTPDVLAYISFNRGFRSGGYNPTVPTLDAFRPEVLDAYEGGLKATLFDRRVRFNAAAFYYDYTDVQVQRYIANVSAVYNGARAELYGFDADLTATLGNDLRLRMAYQYVHGRYKSFPNAVIAVPLTTGGYRQTQGDVSGNRTVLTPTSTLSVGPEYTLHYGNNAIILSGSAYYNSGFFNEPDNVIRQPEYATFNASMRWEFAAGNQALTLFMNNISNEAVQSTAAVNGLNSLGRSFGVARYSYEPPRTYGLKFDVRF